MIKKMVTATTVVVAAVLGIAETASAHVHAIVTPADKVVSIPCEPFHGTTPGASENSANWDPARGLHPIHWGLHKSPAEGRRSIEVVVVGNATCR